MAAAASAWVTTEQELKLAEVLATGFLVLALDFALCLAAAAGNGTTAETATGRPSVPEIVIPVAMKIRRIGCSFVWPVNRLACSTWPGYRIASLVQVGCLCQSGDGTIVLGGAMKFTWF